MPAPVPALTKKVFSINEHCAVCKVGRTKVYQEIAAGRLRTVLRGNRRFVLAEDQDEWLRRHHVAA